MSRQQGWVALLANVVVRRAGEAEVYAATADSHDRPGNPSWGHLRLGDGVPPQTRAGGPSSVLRPQASFGPTTVRFDPHVKCFDGNGLADSSAQRRLAGRYFGDVREPCSAPSPTGPALPWATEHRCVT